MKITTVGQLRKLTEELEDSCRIVFNTRTKENKEDEFSMGKVIFYNGLEFDGIENINNNTELWLSINID
jgi:hypothetical protein